MDGLGDSALLLVPPAGSPIERLFKLGMPEAQAMPQRVGEELVIPIPLSRAIE